MKTTRWVLFVVAALSCSSPKLCRPTNCRGCCVVASNGDQLCEAGTTASACGLGGTECSACGAAQLCSLGDCIAPPDDAGQGGGDAGSSDAGIDAGTDAGTDAGFSCTAMGAGGGAGGGGFGGGGVAGYPAPHPDLPQVVSYGGPVLVNPRPVAISFSNNDPAQQATADCFVQSLGATPFFAGATSEYGVSAMQPAVVVHLAQAGPAQIDDPGIQSWLVNAIASGDAGLPPADPNNVYVLFYPRSTQILLSGLTVCTDFGGYHSEVMIADAGYSYAVVPDCPSFFTGITDAQNLTWAASHELIEAITDPLPLTAPAWVYLDQDHLIWAVVLEGGEVADICGQDQTGAFTPAGYPFTVQRIWSNAAVTSGTGANPCEPMAPGEVYFNSVPVMTDPVKLRFGAAEYNTLGVKLAVGGTKTIDLDLFSSAPVADWQLSARDFSGNGSQLAFSFSQDAGNNGDTVQLTIHYLAVNPTYRGAPFVVFSNGATTRTYFIGFVSAQ